jgi:hypothetical protein
MATQDISKKAKEAAHDEAPSNIVDHPFTPKREWWTLCGHPGCNLAESAHRDTTVGRFRYYSDDVEDST